ncbi:MAG: primosomal protein N' [Clostridia bacterium]|nr:primosomal protein N' [Clostridia bacterium]
MRFVNVVISNNSKELDKLFCYALDENSGAQSGSRVLVPFGNGNKTVEAVIVEFIENCPYENVKNVIKVLDEKPLCTEKQIALAIWIRKKYLCTYNQAIRLVIPSGIVAKSSKFVKLTDNYFSIDDVCGKSSAKRTIVEELISCGGKVPYGNIKSKTALAKLCDEGITQIVEDINLKRPQVKVKMVRLAISKEDATAILPAINKKAPNQAKIIEVLLQTEQLPLKDTVSSASANALCKKGIIEIFEQVKLRNSYEINNIKRTSPLTPTAQQKKVLDGLKYKWDNGDLKPTLIRGVTGSGKTEVFLQIIEYILNQGKQAIVLVPEISLTPQTVERFVGRFGDKVSVLHSGLSQGERYDEWQRILNNQVSVVVGARSAIFAPFNNLGIIIIDEEHESTYKSENQPCYSAIDVALYRGKTENSMVVMGSATPSVNSYKLAKDGIYDLYEIEKRHNNATMPNTTVVDMRNELKRGNKSVFSNLLKEEINKNIKNGQQTILFLNRRGFNSFVTCRDCGQPLVCKNCSITLTYHKNKDCLNCHYCGYETGNVTTCPSCGSKHIKYMGTGTEKAEEEIRSLFGENSYLRMDADTTTGKNSHEAILKKFNKNNVPILLGTQMVTKGLDFKNVTLVGVLAADLSLNIDDFRAAERTFCQLTQVCGRAGRGDISGRAVIQTYQPEHYAVDFARNHDYTGFFENEIEIRKQFNNPPFCDIIMIMMSGKSKSEIASELTKIAQYLKGKGIYVLGPAPSPYSKINNLYRWRIIVKTNRTKDIYPILRQLNDRYTGGKNKIFIDINPNTMN